MFVALLDGLSFGVGLGVDVLEAEAEREMVEVGS